MLHVRGAGLEFTLIRCVVLEVKGLRFFDWVVWTFNGIFAVHGIAFEVQGFVQGVDVRVRGSSFTAEM